MWYKRYMRLQLRIVAGTLRGRKLNYAANPHSMNGNRDSAESGGSGLGLAIVAAIAQAHGGQATLESAPGHGTRVRVWLPATAPATPAPPRAAATPRPSRAGHHPTPPAPATTQPSQPPSPQAGPSPRQPLSDPANHPRLSSTAGRRALAAVTPPGRHGRIPGDPQPDDDDR